LQNKEGRDCLTRHEKEIYPPSTISIKRAPYATLVDAFPLLLLMLAFMAFFASLALSSFFTVDIASAIRKASAPTIKAAMKIHTREALLIARIDKVFMVFCFKCYWIVNFFCFVLMLQKYNHFYLRAAVGVG